MGFHYKPAMSHFAEWYNNEETPGGCLGELQDISIIPLDDVLGYINGLIWLNDIYCGYYDLDDPQLLYAKNKS